MDQKIIVVGCSGASELGKRIARYFEKSVDNITPVFAQDEHKPLSNGCSSEVLGRGISKDCKPLLRDRIWLEEVSPVDSKIFDKLKTRRK